MSVKKAKKSVKKEVLIIGAGPSGLTAAYELQKQRPNFKITLVEADSIIGGISRTIEYKGFRFDIGGHRFFTKNKEVEGLWQEILGDDLLKRPRLSRWYYKGKFFNYPIKPFEVLRVFGPLESTRIMVSLVYSKMFPKKENNLEDWYINQFGHYLAKPFFIDFNEKLWGIPCSQLSMDFGKQRVKGVSIFGILWDNAKKLIGFRGGKVAKSLIEEFLYPRYGPGEMWENFMLAIEKKGGKLLLEHKVVEIGHKGGKIDSVKIADKKGKVHTMKPDYILSTMPMKELALAMRPLPPGNVIEAANALKFRDFISVSLIVNKKDVFPDNWLYTHDPGMRNIRIQNFKNWSPWLVPDLNKTCLGFEYVCNVGDDLWSKSDEQMVEQAILDLERTGFATRADVEDAKVVKLRNVYPVYDLGYQNRVEVLRKYLEQFNSKYPQLQPMGRGGMHRYNNQDHSMYTAILAVRNILGEHLDLWNVNADAEYHEESKEVKNDKKAD